MKSGLKRSLKALVIASLGEDSLKLILHSFFLDNPLLTRKLSQSFCLFREILNEKITTIKVFDPQHFETFRGGGGVQGPEILKL